MNAKGSASKGALIFIFLTILIDVMGIAIIIPVIPTLITSLTGEEFNVAAGYGGLLIISFSAMQFLFAPVLGELSDRYGRRPVLFIALAGLGIDYVFHAFAPTIGWLFVGRLLAGVCGASHTVATAYIADISTPENKAKNFGMIGAAFGLGFFLGPMIGGFCAKWGYQVPFLVAAGMTLLNLVFGILVLPESLPKEKRRPVDLKKVIPGMSLVHLTKYKALGLFIGAFTLVHLAGQVMPATWSFFTMESLSWSETEVGISLGVVGLMVGIVQAGLIGWSVKKFGQYKVIVLGYILQTSGMFFLAFSINELILYLALIPYVLGGVAGPTIQGIMSNSVSEKEQGNLQGALTSMISLTAIIGPLLYTGIFYLYSDKMSEVYFPGAVFIAAGSILLISILLAVSGLRKIKV